ncbi:MAG: MarR family transcriptional regulator [Victivallaceae bacterium]|jgi:DNA-binding MarR family transcriptional regulator|nr:MarR family transcriptional regulator [Victivallaceae bacterium]MDD5663956.1 MarR family transcriptional regulator [Victivallaceae bacterium]
MSALSNDIWKKLFVMSDYLRDSAEELNKTELVKLFKDLTFSQSRVFRTIMHMTDKEPGGLTLKSIAQRLNVSAAAASGMIDLLVQKGIVERSQNQVDRRAVSIRLTDQMYSEIEQIGQFLSLKMNKLMTDFSEDEKKLFEDLLERLYLKVSDKLRITENVEKDNKK